MIEERMKHKKTGIVKASHRTKINHRYSIYQIYRG
jgi:hypothetical protein